MSAYLVREVEAAATIIVRLRTEVAAVHGTGRLEALTLRADTTGATETLPAGALFILIGAEPHTDWLAGTLERDDRGFVLTGRDLLRDGRSPPPGLAAGPATAAARGQLPGVFAASDVRRGSVKRVASAVGEGATAVQLVHQYLSEPAPVVG